MYKSILSLMSLVILVACSDSTRFDEYQALQGKKIPLAKATDQIISAEPIRAVTLPDTEHLNSPMVNLGRSLFHDTRLSGDGTVSCASCHSVADGGDDGLPVSVGIRGQTGPINSPTVLNSGFNFRQFWDGRAKTLADQAKDPVEAGVEMGARWDDVVVTLAKDENLVAEFSNVFGTEQITQQRVVDAIAEFESTLITPSPFDRFLNGETNAISAKARQGYEKFKSYGCISCHQGINVGGNLYQQFGAMQSVDIDEFITEGAKPVVRERDKSVLLVKVPSLRNIELTAPYFNQGKVYELPTAVRIMGLSQLGLEIPQEDIDLIVEFLKSLTGNINVHTALID